MGQNLEHFKVVDNVFENIQLSLRSNLIEQCQARTALITGAIKAYEQEDASSFLVCATAADFVQEEIAEINRKILFYKWALPYYKAEAGETLDFSDGSAGKSVSTTSVYQAEPISATSVYDGEPIWVGSAGLFSLRVKPVPWPQ